MADFSRRSLLRALGAGSALAGLAACTLTTTHGVTTITLNVAEFAYDANIALSVVKTALGFAPIPATIVTVVNEAISLLQTGITAFKTYAGSDISLTFDTRNVPAAIQSLIHDVQTVSANLSAVAASESAAMNSGLMSKVEAVAADIANIASILASIVTVTMGAGEGMTAANARMTRIEAIKSRHGLI